MTKIAHITAKIGGLTLGFISFVNLTPADAATFTFDAGDNDLSVITKTVDGITLIASNPSSPNPLSGGFGADSDGICVLGTSTFCNDGIDKFNLQFDTTVQLISYQVGFNNSRTKTEIITLTAGSSSSTQTVFTDEATINFTNQFIVPANQVISVASNTFTVGALQWREITVTEVMSVTTPEPMSLVALLGVGALGFATRKKK